MIFGIGTDIIEVERIEKQINSGGSFKEKIFTEGEIKYCESKKFSAQNFAARFAAKEACFKAIGTGWSDGFSFKEIEVVNDEMGKPELVFHGGVEEFIKENKIINSNISLSHIKEFVTAIVILEKQTKIYKFLTI